MFDHVFYTWILTDASFKALEMLHSKVRRSCCLQDIGMYQTSCRLVFLLCFHHFLSFLRKRKYFFRSGKGFSDFLKCNLTSWQAVHKKKQCLETHWKGNRLSLHFPVKWKHDKIMAYPKYVNYMLSANLPVSDYSQPRLQFESKYSLKRSV